MCCAWFDHLTECGVPETGRKAIRYAVVAGLHCEVVCRFALVVLLLWVRTTAVTMAMIMLLYGCNVSMQTFLFYTASYLH